MFGNKTVDSVIKKFTQIVTDLEEVSKFNTSMEFKKESQAATLQQEAASCRTESERAEKLIKKFNELLEV